MRRILLLVIIVCLTVPTKAQLLKLLINGNQSTSGPVTTPAADTDAIYSTWVGTLLPNFRRTRNLTPGQFISITLTGTPSGTYGYTTQTIKQTYWKRTFSNPLFYYIDRDQFAYQDDSVLSGNGGMSPCAGRLLIRADNDTPTVIGFGANPLPYKLRLTEYIASDDNTGPFGFYFDYHTDHPLLGPVGGYESYNWYGGHGYPAIDVVQTGGTAKGFNDIGVWYHDSTVAGINHKFRIHEIRGVRNYFFISQNTSTQGMLGYLYNYDMIGTRLWFDSAMNVGKNLYGADTSVITYTSTNDGRALYGMTTFQKPDYYINGRHVTLDSQFTINNVTSYQQLEQLELLDPNSTDDSILANKPPGGYQSAPSHRRGHGIIRMSHLIDAQKNGIDVGVTVIEILDTVGMLAYQNTMDSWIFHADVGKWLPNLSNVDTAIRYFDALPISDGGRLHDYRLGNNMLDSPFAGSYQINSTYYNNGVAPTMRFDYLHGNVDNIPVSMNMIMGRERMYWLDSPEIRNIYALLLFGTQKDYLSSIALGVTQGQIQYPGTVYKLVEYKGYKTPPTDGKTCEYAINVNDTLRYRADFQHTGTYSIDPAIIPAGMSYHDYVPARKTANVSISGSTITVAPLSSPIMWMGYSHDGVGWIEGYIK